jgi:hypothetical protein
VLVIHYIEVEIMTILQCVTRAAAGTAIVFSLASANAIAALPEGDFACQVEIAGGKMGLVLVQSDSKQDALAAARVGNAITADGGSAAVLGVVQCITRRTDERFRDAEFQMQYAKTPL